MVMPVRNINKARFMELWNAGASHMAMGEAFGCSDNTIERRAKMWGLPTRFRSRKGIPRDMPSNTIPIHESSTEQVPEPLDVITHPLGDHPQASAILDAIKRAKGSPAALGQIAARFRVRVSVLNELAGVR